MSTTKAISGHLAPRMEHQHPSGPTRDTASAVEVSVVVPMCNEAPNIDRFFARLQPTLDRLGVSYEIVCIDDGSSDDTLERLVAYRRRNSAVKVLSLSRNFGKDIALSAGFDHACGAAVIPIDADLQDPPELIECLVAKWREGFDVVYAQRRSRVGESPLRRFTAYLFYRLFSKLTDVPMPPDTGDFRLLDRRVVQILGTLPERGRFMKGLFAWVGFRQTAVSYDREERHAGKTKWSYWRLWNFAIDGVTSFSSSPLKIASYVGFAVVLTAFAGAGFITIRTAIWGTHFPRYASLMIAMMILSGIQLIAIGVLGEYLGRVYNEVKRRPLYLVNQYHGFDFGKSAPRLRFGSPIAAPPASDMGHEGA